VHRHTHIGLDIVKEASRLTTVHRDLEDIAGLTRQTLGIDVVESCFAEIHESNSDMVFVRYLGELIHINGVAALK
jgi:hypothetical protein